VPSFAPTGAELIPLSTHRSRGGLQHFAPVGARSRRRKWRRHHAPCRRWRRSRRL